MGAHILPLDWFVPWIYVVPIIKENWLWKKEYIIPRKPMLCSPGWIYCCPSWLSWVCLHQLLLIWCQDLWTCTGSRTEDIPYVYRLIQYVRRYHICHDYTFHCRWPSPKELSSAQMDYESNIGKRYRDFGYLCGCTVSSFSQCRICKDHVDKYQFVDAHHRSSDCDFVFPVY